MPKKSPALVVLPQTPPPSTAVAIRDIGNLVGVPDAADPQQLLSIAQHCVSAAALNIARAGACLLRLKDQLPHGEFAPAIEASGMSVRTAQEAMSIARYLGSLDAGQAQRMLKLPGSKVLELSRAEPEVVQQLLDDGALDGDEPLSVRELRQRLKAAQRAAVDAETRLKARDVEAQRAAELAGRASPAIDKRYAALRDRGMHLVQRITHELGLLRDLVQTELVDGYSPKNDDAADRRAVVSVLYHGLGGAMVVTNEIRASVSNTYSTNVTGTLLAEHRYRAAEALDLRQLAEAACTAAEADDTAAKVKARKDHKLVGRHG